MGVGLYCDKTQKNKDIFMKIVIPFLAKYVILIKESKRQGMMGGQGGRLILWLIEYS